LGLTPRPGAALFQHAADEVRASLVQHAADEARGASGLLGGRLVDGWREGGCGSGGGGDGDGERIGGVGLGWGLGKLEQGGDGVLHLVLGGPAVAGDSTLDLGWRQFVAWHSVLAGCEQHHAAGMAHLKCRLDAVAVNEDLLDDDRARSTLGDEVVEGLMQRRQSLRQWSPLRNPDDPCFDHTLRDAGRPGLNAAVSAQAEARVNAENPHGPLASLNSDLP